MSESAGIPQELGNVRIRVKDLQNVVHTLRGLSCGKNGILSFKKGTLNYNIPISSIKKISLISKSEERVKLKVTFNGKAEEFEMSANTRCFSRSEIGTVSFYIKEIKEIELLQGETK